MNIFSRFKSNEKQIPDTNSLELAGLITEESPRIEPLKDLSIPLKPHQLASIYRTLELEGEEKDERFLVLADLPGAGKTNVVLGHIYALKLKLLKENPYLDKDEEERSPSLIVVPQNIISQWIESMNKYFKKKLKFKKLINYEDMMALYKNTKMLYQYDIILITPLQYNMICTTLQDKVIQWDRIIFDEIDTISSMIQNKIKCKNVWFVSASFKNDRIGTYYSTISDKEVERVSVQCEEAFIRSSFPLEEPETTKYVSINKYVDETLVTLVNEEELKGMNALDYTKMKNEYFKKIPYNDEGAVELVVEENRNELEFIRMRIEDMKKEMIRLKRDIDEDGLEINEEEEGSDDQDPRIQMYKEYMTRIKKDEINMKDVEKKKDLIRNKVSKNRICMVCYQDIENKKVKEEFMKEIFRTECCKTDYCIDCIHYLFDAEKRRIEMKKKEEELKRRREEKEKRRQGLTTEENLSLPPPPPEEKKEESSETSVTNDVEKERDYKKDFEDIEIECKKCDKKLKYDICKRMRMLKRRGKEEKKKDRTTKLERVETIFKMNQLNTEKKKYIIFSDYYNTFRFIKDLLNKMEIKFLELDGGSIETIDKAVKEYREGESQVLLSNSTFFGCGLNMEFTTDIIFMHKMEPTIEKQVIGRAQRPGRTNILKVHYLFYDNEENGKEIVYESHTDFYLDDEIHAIAIEDLEL